VAAISADGFEAKDKGKTFWTDIRSQYEAALKTAGDTASAVSSGVSSKNVLRGELIKAMEALQFALQANYPDTYEAEYRAGLAERSLLVPDTSTTFIHITVKSPANDRRAFYCRYCFRVITTGLSKTLLINGGAPCFRKKPGSALLSGVDIKAQLVYIGS
jgi:hypothetical protein